MPVSVGQLVRACARFQSLAASVLRSALGGVAQGVRNDLTLPWVLDSRRIRGLLPDGIGWHGEDAFLEALLPHVHSRARPRDRVWRRGPGRRDVRGRRSPRRRSPLRRKKG